MPEADTVTNGFSAIWTYPLIKLGDGGVLTVGQVILAVVVAIIGLLLSKAGARLASRNLRRARVGPDAANTVEKLVFYGLAVVVVLTALRMLQIPITALTFMSGAVAIGIGFGAQNIINNFISGWILMSERPLRVGDFIEIEEAKGVIEMVGNRSTRIRRTDGVHLLVPNSLLLERTLVNWTLVDRDIRTYVRVGVMYGSPVRDVERLILQATGEHDSVKKMPAPRVIFEDFGDNALIFDALFWCEAGVETSLRQVRSDIRFRIDELFREAGIVIAFPQRDVHLDSLKPVEVRLINEPEMK